MDRPLTTHQRRRRIAKQVALPLVATAIIATLVLVLPSWVRPTLDRGYIRTSVVDVGPVEAGVSGSGVVVPASELGVFCPLAASAVQVLQRPGNAVAAGDTLLQLDVSDTHSRLSELEEELALTQNRRAQLDIELERDMTQSASRRRVKQLEWENLATRTSQSRKLLAMGAVSAEYVREAELAEEKAAIELEQLDQGIATAREEGANRREALDLTIAALRRQVQETRGLLQWTYVRAPDDGVLTSVSVEVGESVYVGQEVARIADLSAFRIDAVVAAAHARSVAPNMRVVVDVTHDQELSAWVDHVLPNAEGGALRLDVRLDEPSSPLLRLQMRLNVFIVTEQHEEALRVAKGPFATGGGVHDVFVVDGDAARRCPIHLGLVGRRYYEVLGGAAAGDEVIISDMRDYLHLAQLDIE